MSEHTRAMFRCHRETTNSYSPGHVSREYEFVAVSDDQTPEHQRYHKATPAGKLTITVDNPVVRFMPGGNYYLDFKPVAAE